MCTVALSVTTFCHSQHPCSADPVIVYVHYKFLLDFDLVCVHVRVFVCACVCCVHMIVLPLGSEDNMRGLVLSFHQHEFCELN